MSPLDIRPDHLTIVQDILHQQVPKRAVWAFGSRAKWLAREYSDLDLCVLGDAPLSFRNLELLEQAFADSDLPYKVDVVDWATISESFRKIIERDKVMVQEGLGVGSEWKETPYGKFAADFYIDRLASLCDPEVGIQTGPFGSQLHQQDYVHIGTPIITVEHISENRILHVNTPKVSEADARRLSRYRLNKGDIVFSRVGSVDRRALVHDEEKGWLFSGRCLRVRPDPAKIDPQYLSYFFGLPAFKEHIRSIAVGATMPSLNTSLLSGITVPHPPSIKEQRAIAHILGTLDDKIELNRRMNETLEAMARALFKAWFVDFEPVRAKCRGTACRAPTGGVPLDDFPKDDANAWQWPQHILDLFPDRLVESKLGDIPEGWEIRQISDFLTLVYGKSLPAERRNPGNVPVYGSGGITGFHDTALVGDQAVIVGRKGTVGSLYWEQSPSFPIDTVFYLQPLVSLSFCYHLLESLPLRDMNTDAAVPGLNRQNVYRLEIVSPPQVLIEYFSAFAKKLRSEIFSLQNESHSLTHLRDSLLPKLISGQLRVADAEAFLKDWL